MRDSKYTALTSSWLKSVIFYRAELRDLAPHVLRQTITQIRFLHTFTLSALESGRAIEDGLI